MSKKKIVATFTCKDLYKAYACGEEVDRFKANMKRKFGREIEDDEPINFIHVLEQRQGFWEVHFDWLMQNAYYFEFVNEILTEVGRKFKKELNDINDCTCCGCCEDFMANKYRTKSKKIEFLKSIINMAVGHPAKKRKKK